MIESSLASSSRLDSVVRLRRRDAVLDPRVDHVLVEPPVPADLRTRHLAGLAQLVQRRLGQLDVRRQVVKGHNVVLRLGRRLHLSRKGRRDGMPPRPRERIISAGVYCCQRWRCQSLNRGRDSYPPPHPRSSLLERFLHEICAGERTEKQGSNAQTAKKGISNEI